MANGFVVTVKIVYRSDVFVFNPVRKLLLCTSNVCHNFSPIKIMHEHFCQWLIDHSDCPKKLPFSG